jgi:hypothetical protein
VGANVPLGEVVGVVEFLAVVVVAVLEGMVEDGVTVVWGSGIQMMYSSLQPCAKSGVMILEYCWLDWKYGMLCTNGNSAMLNKDIG